MADVIEQTKRALQSNLYGDKNDALVAARQEITKLRRALSGLLKFCDTGSSQETEWERAVARARKAIEP